MTSVTDPWINALLGQALDDYIIEDVLGTGAFGYVFRARHAPTGRFFAVKVLSPQAATNVSSATEFVKQGELLVKLSGSSNVVAHVDTAICDIQLTMPGPQALMVPLSVRYHVLELADGCLSDLLPQAASMTWHEKIALWRGAVLGIHQMHLRHIVHRDLKASNCLMFPKGRGATDCKISDLGRARDMDAPAMHDPMQYLQGLGDMRFAPPEFLYLQGTESREGHRAADLYGLGSLLFEIVTGQGLTAMAFGPFMPIMQQAFADLQRGIRTDLMSLRSNFALAHLGFSNELPKVLRHEAVPLLRRLCDPVPDRRFPQRSPGRRAVRDDGLQRLLRSADILLKVASQADQLELQKLRKGA